MADDPGDAALKQLACSPMIGQLAQLLGRAGAEGVLLFRGVQPGAAIQVLGLARNGSATAVVEMVAAAQVALLEVEHKRIDPRPGPN